LSLERFLHSELLDGPACCSPLLTSTTVADGAVGSDAA
jgi:hypothetical protein